MQNGWKTGKIQGQPLYGIALIPYYIYIVAAKNRNHTC